MVITQVAAFEWVSLNHGEIVVNNTEKKMRRQHRVSPDVAALVSATLLRGQKTFHVLVGQMECELIQ